MNCTAGTSALHQTHTSVSTSELPCIRENILWCCISRRKKLCIFAQNFQLFYCTITPPEGAVKLIYFYCSVLMSAYHVWRQNKLCVSVSASLMWLFSLPPVSRFLTSLRTSASSGISLPRCLNISASSSSASSRLMFSSTPSLCPSN